MSCGVFAQHALGLGLDFSRRADDDARLVPVVEVVVVVFVDLDVVVGPDEELAGRELVVELQERRVVAVGERDGGVAQAVGVAGQPGQALQLVLDAGVAVALDFEGGLGHAHADHAPLGGLELERLVRHRLAQAHVGQLRRDAARPRAAHRLVVVVLEAPALHDQVLEFRDFRQEQAQRQVAHARLLLLLAQLEPHNGAVLVVALGHDVCLHLARVFEFRGFLAGQLFGLDVLETGLAHVLRARSAP